MSKKTEKEEISNNKSVSTSSCTRTLYMITTAFYIAELIWFYSAANSKSEVEKNCKIQKAEEAFIFGTISLAGALVNHLIDKKLIYNSSSEDSNKSSTEEVQEYTVTGDSNC